MKTILSLFLFLGLIGCATHPFPEGHENYIEKVEEHSAGDHQFSGIYENFEFKATLLNRDMSEALHKRLKKYYDWSEQKAAQEQQKREDDFKKETKIWLSFYTPERKNDNLANKISIWKVYLEVGGERYEGHPQKANKNFAEATALFPYHSRWATAYYVDFPVPTDQVGQSPKLIITGPLGRREVVF